MQQTISNHRTWLSEPSPQITTITTTTTTTHPSSLVIVESLEDPSKKGGVKKFEGIKGMISENAILVFGRRGCCMCHVVKRLLLGLGVNPSVYEVIDEKDEILLIHELERLSSTSTHENDTDHDGIIRRRRPITIDQFPCVYIGGKLFGGLDQLMGAHISGDLIPILKKAGALWL